MEMGCTIAVQNRNAMTVLPVSFLIPMIVSLFAPLVTWSRRLRCSPNLRVEKTYTRWSAPALPKSLLLRCLRVHLLCLRVFVSGWLVYVTIGTSKIGLGFWDGLRQVHPFSAARTVIPQCRTLFTMLVFDFTSRSDFINF